MGGWKGGRKESICVFLYLIENKINRMEKVVCLNLLSYPYYIRIILKKSITNGWISQYMYNTHFLSNLERKVFAGPEWTTSTPPFYSSFSLMNQIRENKSFSPPFPPYFLSKLGMFRWEQREVGGLKRFVFFIMCVWFCELKSGRSKRFVGLG